jgi:ABC-type amino acid transport substrate-binding protein
MSSKNNKNTEGLKAFAEKKNQETIEKVNKAIDKLKRSKTKNINFKTVAEEAGVSKATLYNNDIVLIFSRIFKNYTNKPT